MPTTVPCLWFDGRAEEAAQLYTQVFPDSAVTSTSRWGPGDHGREGEVITVEFHLGGQAFLGLNGGPSQGFTPAVSFQIPCEDQAEVDHYWDRLSEGGSEGRCGWLEDRFGLSWQVVPTALPRLLGDPDPGRSGRAMAAMMQMGRLVVADLERAADDAPA